MNILIINPILYTPACRGGIVPKISSITHTMIYNYCLGFIEQGHNVTLIASEEYKPTENSSFEFDIIFLKNSIKEKFKKFPNGFPYLSGLYGYLKQNKDLFDVIISSESFTYNSLIASIVCPQKLVIWQEVGVHTPTFQKIPSKIWHNTIARILYRDILIIPRSKNAQTFIRQYCKNVSEEIVDHGIDIENFNFSADKRPYFVVVARLEWRKNIALTIEKFSRFHKTHDDYKLYIAGCGEEYDALVRKIETEGLTDSVILTGFLSREILSKLIRHASCSMLDSHNEYNIVSVLESIACGTPFITNTVPYYASLLNEEKLGIAKDDWDSDDLQYIIDNLSKYTQGCFAYRPKLSTKYSTENMLNIFQRYHEDTSNK